MREYAADWEALKATDPEVASAVANELERERTNLRLIASENYASPAVLAALGSTMNNKYAEGYPGRRYYGGCEFVDVTETARDRAGEGAVRGRPRERAAPRRRPGEHGGVRRVPRHRATPSEKVLGHGARPRRPPHARLAGQRLAASGSTSSATRSTRRPSSSTWTASATSPRSTGRRSSWPATPPTRATIDFAAFREIADEVGALLMVDASHFIGLVAGGAYPIPVPYADVVTFTTHKTLRGRAAR